METLLGLVTLGCLGLLLYAYLLYPALLWMLRSLVPGEEHRDIEPAEWPEVSVVLSAYNEEDVIGERIDNLLRVDYPGVRLEILVGSDGSTDRTCEIVARYQPAGVRLVAFTDRRGKASVVNDLITRAKGEIVVMTDANTFFRPDAIRELVKALRRFPAASAVVGRLDLHAPAGTGNLDGVYWRFEIWLKTLESHFGAVPGANGAIYAFYRRRYEPLPKEAIVDDFLIPMLMRLRSGGKIFFVPSARAWEYSPGSLSDEFRRRARMGAGDLQAVLWTWPLLLPWKGMIAPAYFAHKVLRWFGPWLMLVAFVINLWLLQSDLFRGLFLGQLLFYALGLGAHLFRHVPLVRFVAFAIRYFLILNGGLLLGFIRSFLGFSRPFWTPTPRRA